MKGFLLDTNICVHYLKGEYDLQAKILEIGYQSCFISEITIAELLYGVENGSAERHKENSQRVLDFQFVFSDRIILIGECFHLYAREKARMRRKGRTVGEFDLIIGTSAIANELILVTRNTKDFENLAEIQLENWIDI